MTESHDVAHQGVPGAFAEEAAIAFVGEQATRLPVPRFADVFCAVVEGRARRGVVPIENSLAGSVHESYDLLGVERVTIVGERVQRIRHALIAAPGVRLEDVRRVSSHPVALAQCEKFFRINPKIEAVAAYNTAGAIADVIASGARDTAAIGARRAADLYGGVVLLDGIEDDPENFTRFLLIARDDVEGTRDAAVAWKTSLVFALPHRPGSLAHLLELFASRSLDLTKIESRPIAGRPFEYAFYVDVVGPPDTAKLESALEEARARTTSLRVLGTYSAPAP